MKQIPTAKELYLKTLFPTLFENKRDEVELWFETDDHAKEHIEVMIEFAKLHVEVALRAASLEAHTKDVPYTDDVEVDENSILNSYPLKNIK
jgi:hypothetical protein